MTRPTGPLSGATHSPAQRPPSSKPLIGITLLILSVWVLSALDASAKWVMAAGVPLWIVCWLRYTVHLVVVLTLVIPKRGLSILRSQRPREQLFRGTAMLCATLSFFTTLSYMPQAEATAINFLAPLLVLAAAPWLLNEPPKASRWIAASVAFGGVLIIIRPDSGLHPTGIFFGLLTACCFAAQFIATRRLAADNPYTSLIWGGLIGTICLTATLPFTLPSALPVLNELSVANWMLLISMGFSGALGHLLQIAAYRNASASTLAPFIYLQIVSATAIGWFAWGQFPDALTWLGITIICTSGMIIGALEWRRGKHPVR